MGTHPIFESDFDYLTDSYKNESAIGFGKDLPLDELVNYQSKQIQQYAQWSLKNAQSALGSNHQAEMEENNGIARNRRKQNQEKYKSTLKKLETQNLRATAKLSSSMETKKKNSVKRKRIDSPKTEAGSDDEITIKKIHTP